MCLTWSIAVCHNCDTTLSFLSFTCICAFANNSTFQHMPCVLLCLVTCGHICDVKSNSLRCLILTHSSYSNLSSWIIAHVLDLKMFWAKGRKDTTRMYFLANFQTQLGLRSRDIWEMVRARCGATDQTARNDFEITSTGALYSAAMPFRIAVWLRQYVSVKTNLYRVCICTDKNLVGCVLLSVCWDTCIALLLHSLHWASERSVG